MTEALYIHQVRRQGILETRRSTPGAWQGFSSLQCCGSEKPCRSCRSSRVSVKPLLSLPPQNPMNPTHPTPPPNLHPVCRTCPEPRTTLPVSQNRQWECTLKTSASKAGRSEADCPGRSSTVMQSILCANSPLFQPTQVYLPI